jgi:hypothetical protein
MTCSFYYLHLPLNSWNKRIVVSFEHETLKTENAAEDHIRQFMPKLAETDVGMSILEICFSLPIFFMFMFYNCTIVTVSYNFMLVRFGFD